MEIGFTGQAVIVLHKPVDSEEPTRMIVNIERINEVGVTIAYEDNDENTHRYFIPFSNICGIEEWAEEEGEDEEDEGGQPALAQPTMGGQV